MTAGFQWQPPSDVRAQTRNRLLWHDTRAKRTKCTLESVLVGWSQNFQTQKNSQSTPNFKQTFAKTTWEDRYLRSASGNHGNRCCRGGLSPAHHLVFREKSDEVEIACQEIWDIVLAAVDFQLWANNGRFRGGD